MRALILSLAALAVAMPAAAQVQWTKATMTSPRVAPNEGPPAPPADNKDSDVVMSLCIDAKGAATKVDLKRSTASKPHTDAVLAWARKVKYVPAQQDGKPLSVCGYPLTMAYRAPRAPAGQPGQGMPAPIFPQSPRPQGDR